MLLPEFARGRIGPEGVCETGFSFGFDRRSKAIDWGLGRLRAIGKQETRAGRGACTQENRQECLPYLNACRYLCHFRRNAPGGSGRGKKSINYETKPTSLLESAIVLGKRCKKPPKRETKSLQEAPNRGLFNGFWRGLAGVNEEWQASGNACC